MLDALRARKNKKELEAQQAREQAEWDAKQAAKSSKREIAKLISSIEKNEQQIIANAAAAKVKGYNDIYRTQLSALKVARARKTQAEKFLFQIETMECMKSLADNSQKLLGSMGEIMNTLGKLTLDKNEIKKNQMDFMNAQKTLDQQSFSIDQFFSQMEAGLPDEDDAMMMDVDYSHDDLDREINAYILGQNGGVAADGNHSTSSATNDEVEQLRQLLNS